MAETLRTLLSERTHGERALQLWRHVMDGSVEHELVVNGVFVMATYNAPSSEMLSRRAIERLNRRCGRLLIGGLGFGYSVREALRCDPPPRAVDVVEIEDTVIEWNATLLSGLNGRHITDPRVTVIHDDFIRYINKTGILYDAIVMDIDNGPMLLVNEGNAAAYAAGFFARVRRALAPGGVFGIWSCNEDGALLDEMRAVFHDCEVETVTERHGHRDVPYYLYFSHSALPGVTS